METYQGVTESDTTVQLMYTQDIALNFLNFSTQYQTKHKPRLLMFLAIYLHVFARVCACSVVSHSVTPWTVAHQAPRSMGFPRQEY